MGEPAITHEFIAPHFEKFHLDGPWPVQPAIHHHTAPDLGDPHSHPWAFTTLVMSGSYVEEVFHITPDGWNSELVQRTAGCAYDIPIDHIHRIVELPDGNCWTMVLAGPQERETTFWRFASDGRVEARVWHSGEWKTRSQPDIARR